VTEALLLALGAGVLAAVNPCGFALLPAYVSLLVVDADEAGRARAVRRALVSAAALTAGFVAVFAAFGLIVSPIAAGVQRYLPVVTVGIGLAVIAAGGWLLAGRVLPGLGWSPSGPRPSRRLPAMIGFGMTYAVASLTCTIAPFLAIVVGSFRTGSIGQGVALFVAYGVGMGLLVGVVAVSVALTRTTVVDRLRRAGGWASRVTGALLVVVGGYVAYYGWWEVRVLGGGSPDDPIVNGAAALQAQLAAAVDWLGAARLAVALILLVGIGVTIGPLRRRLHARRTSPR
jgi:cytochrome c-type biogenesis protein